MSRPVFDIEKLERLPEEQEVLVSHEFRLLAARVAQQMQEFWESNGHTEQPEAIIQRNAYSPQEEAERDEFMRQLSQVRRADVEVYLNSAENLWKQHNEDNGLEDVVKLEPWMADALGLLDVDSETEYEGIKREVTMTIVTNTSFVLTELEAQTGINGEYSRVIFLAAIPGQPEA